jgi:uncharacterized phiE125 gp8 family phage protein
MTLVRIAGATTYPVTLAEVRANGRVTTTSEDGLLDGLIAAATEHVEEYTGRLYSTQTWEEVLDAFPDENIEITLGPVSSVTSIKYLLSETLTTLDSDEYTVDTVSATCRIAPVDAWPDADEVMNAVKVRFVAGSATSSKAVKQAIILLVEHWFENRGAAGDVAMKELPFAVTHLLATQRRMFV